MLILQEYQGDHLKDLRESDEVRPDIILELRQSAEGDNQVSGPFDGSPGGQGETCMA